MSHDSIPLCDALEHFCNAQTWSEYRACFRDKEAALAALNPIGRGSLHLGAQEMAQLNLRDESHVRRLRSFELGDRLIEELRLGLKANRLAIAGFHLQSSKIVLIPANVSDRLSLDFVNGSAELGEARYLSVAVQRIGENETPDMANRCAEWLTERRMAHGDEKRESLKLLARTHFEGKITDRDFDTAFKRVYQRKRGKPRKSAAQ